MLSVGPGYKMWQNFIFLHIFIVFGFPQYILDTAVWNNFYMTRTTRGTLMERAIFKKKLIYAILIITIVLAVVPWIRPGLPVTDDFQNHMVRFWFFKESMLKTGTISPWMPCLFYGYPTFHFYHFFSYLISLPAIFFLNPVTAIKVSVIAAFVALGLCTFYATLLLFKDRLIALFSTIPFVLSHFLFEQANANGSISRIWAIAFVPLSFAFFIRSVEDGKKSYLLCSVLLLAMICLTHISYGFIALTMCFLYLLYVLFFEKSLARTSASKFFFVLIFTLLLVSFWLVPLMTEFSYSNLGEFATGVKGSNLKIFGFDPAFKDYSNFLVPGFVEPSLYIGYSIILFAIYSFVFLRKEKRIKLMGFLIIATLMLIADLFGFSIIGFIPFSRMVLGGRAYYFIIPILFAFSCLAAVFMKALIERFEKHKNYMLTIFIVVLFLEFLPFAFVFPHTWYKAPDWRYHNGAQAIDVLNYIRNDSSVFRVYSPRPAIPSLVIAAPYMFHEKPELGYEWEGDPQSPARVDYDLAKEIKNGLSDQIHPEFSKVVGYVGGKYIVTVCMPPLQEKFKVVYTHKPYCAYLNQDFRPLVQVPKYVLITQSFTVFNQSIDLDAAYLLDNCTSDCLLKNNPGEISDLDFGSDKISFNYSSGEGGVVLVKSAYFKPHWHAFAEEKKLRIREAWPNFMLIDVPAGNHKITIKYTTHATHIMFGAISLAALVFLLLFTLTNIHKKT